jgi:small subunit ribosomal protein S6
MDPDPEGVFDLRTYETAIIWNASIPEADLEGELNAVVEIIKGADGTHEGTEKWGRRLLAYPISKQTEGVYHFIRWTGESDIIARIDKLLRIHEGCLRYLTLRSDGEGAVPEGGRPEMDFDDHPEYDEPFSEEDGMEEGDD